MRMRMDHKSKSSRRIAIASFVGTAIEWYDFYLYGTASALIFNQLFFPKFSPLIGMMASFATYSAGFFARPLGAVVFGHFGDKISRKKMLVFTLTTMGLATFLIGLLPTYHQAGIWAPILLVLLRLIQGLAVGGEWGGAIVMVAEHSREKERGFYSSWPNAGAPFGLVLSIIVYLACSSLANNQFLIWGWRIPFLFGIILVSIGLFIRLSIAESPIFYNLKKASKIPALEVMRTSKKNFLLAIGSRFVESASFYIFTVFVLSYATYELNLSKIMLLFGVMFASLIETLSIPFFGHLSDHLGRRPVYLFGAILVALFAFPFFWLLQTKIPILIWLAIIFPLTVGHAAMHGPQAAFISELFKTRVRYSGAAIAYHLSAAFSGGLAPLIATSLLAWTGATWPISLYLILMALISILSIFLAKETTRQDISK